MIAYFPQIYPDELIYSQLARYYAHTGYLAYIFAAEDLFAIKTTRPDIEFVNAYSQDAFSMITRDMPFADLIMKHTMFPYFGRFVPPQRRRKGFDSLVSAKNDYKNLLSMPARKDRVPRKLRYCPLCADDDRRTYGETYWHRTHQMVGVNICPKHHCYLINTDILLNSKVSPAFVAAETIVNDRDDVAFSDNGLECRLAEYIAKVFQSSIDLQSDVSTGQFLHTRLENTKYLSLRGEQRNMALLHADFSAFYAALPQNEFNQQWQLQKVFTNNRHNANEICMLAMFLGISVEDLVHMELPDTPQKQLFDEKIKKLHDERLNYQQIAHKLNASYNTVKAIGEGLYHKYHYYSDHPNIGGAKKHDWESIDTATLPLVKDLICKMTGDGTTRPVKITIGLVERHLGLPKKGLRYCPRCRAEILKYSETQEEYWARELVWAVNTILRDGRTPNITTIQRITNMRKSYIVACLPYINKYCDTNTIRIIMSIV